MSARIDWTDEEFEMLADTILSMVAEGYSVTDACDRFEAETNGRRSSNTARYKWNSRLMSKYKQQYEEAKLQGAQKAVELRKIQSRQSPSSSESDQFKQFLLTLERPLQMTKRDLIKFIRHADIVDDDTERLKAEMDRIVEERDELKRELHELRVEFDAMKQEHDTLLQAFRVARDSVVSTPSKASIKVDKNGVVQGVTTRDE